MLSSRSLLVALFVGIGAVAGCATSTGDGEGLDSTGSDLTGTNAGPIFNGDTKPGNYNGTALSYTFTVTGNYNVRADGTVAGNDPQVFITDAGGTVLSAADGGPRATTSTPAGTTKTYHLIIKGRNATPGATTVTLNLTPGSCTGDEAWYDYNFSCGEGQPLNCPPGKSSFHNNCGCGCER